MSAAPPKVEMLDADVAVIGGGLAGVCAAVAAARGGARTVLLQDRPALGGNASAEIGVKVQGADELGKYRFSRETGILNEIHEANVDFPNPCQSPSIFSLVLWAFCLEQENLTVLLNCAVHGPRVEDGRIADVAWRQDTTEREGRLRAKVFIDASGDGRVAAEAGAPFLYGREDRAAHGESLGEAAADARTMGSTVYFKVRDLGRPVPFAPPPWAKRFGTDADFPGLLMDCPHQLAALQGTTGGYWWIEIGGLRDVVADAESIRDELYAIVLGVWDHIKNHGDHGAETLVLESVGHVPGRRESRRFVGDHLLTQDDVVSLRRFPDAVAYGGWHVDMHNPKGTLAAPERYWRGRLLAGRYTIPYRSLCAKTVGNLLFAGRNISATHVAMGTTRVMATCALMGQAAGSAAALCVRHGCSPRAVGERHLEALRQALLADDAYIPGVRRAPNLAATATASATSSAALVFPQRETWHPVGGGVAQGFFHDGDRLDGAALEFRNDGDAPVRVVATLHPAAVADDFTDDTVLATAEVRVPPGVHEAAFDFGGAALAPVRCHWLRWVADGDGVSAAFNPTREAPAAQAGRREPQIFTENEFFMRRIRGSFALRLTPEAKPFGPGQAVTGVTRPEASANVWISEAGLPQTLTLSWPEAVTVSGVELVFDNRLDQTAAQWCESGPPPELVRRCGVVAQTEAGPRTLLAVDGNRRRIVRAACTPPCRTREVAVTVRETWGASRARIVEVRCF